MNIFFTILEIHLVFMILSAILYIYINDLMYKRILEISTQKGFENPEEIAVKYTKINKYDFIDFSTPILNILFVVIATINLIKNRDEYINKLIIEMFK